MDATMDDYQNQPKQQSVEDAWQYSQQLWSARSASEAWATFKNVVGALPGWATVALAIVLVGMLAKSSVIVYPLAAVAFLGATFVTVKRAVISALRDYDSGSST